MTGVQLYPKENILLLFQDWRAPLSFRPSEPAERLPLANVKGLLLQLCLSTLRVALVLSFM